MKYKFEREPIQAVLTSSEDCQNLIESITEETKLMMQELERTKAEFVAQEKRDKNEVKTFRKGKDVYVKVNDVEGLVNKILDERGFGIGHTSEMPTLSGSVRVVPLSEIREETIPDSLLRALQSLK